MSGLPEVSRGHSTAEGQEKREGPNVKTLRKLNSCDSGVNNSQLTQVSLQAGWMGEALIDGRKS